MKNSKTVIVGSLLAVLTAGSLSHAQVACENLISAAATVAGTQTKQSVAAWRDDATHRLGNGTVVPTSPVREEFMQQAVAFQKGYMEGEIKFEGKTIYKKYSDTPQMILVQAEGTRVDVEAKALKRDADLKNGEPIPLNYTASKLDLSNPRQGWHQGDVMKLNVSNLGPGGVLKASLLLPVSAHTDAGDPKLTNATKWSKSDKYQVQAKDKSGKVTIIAADSQSLDFTTIHEVEIPMKKGEPVELTYWRNGSLGVGGYADGRTFIITWDGK